MDATDRIVTVVVNDGDTNSNTATTTITVVPVNDAPVLDLDGDNSSTSTNADYQTTFTEGPGSATGTAVAIADTDISITDVDDSNIESAVITLTNTKTGDVFDTSAIVGLTVTPSTSGDDTIITLTGSKTLAEYQTAIKAITFANTNEDMDAADRIVTVVVNDGNINSNTATTTITVVPVNDVPVANNVAATVDKDESVAITLTGSDVDSTVSHFKVSTLPTDGLLYKDAGLTQLVVLNQDMAATTNQLTIYFKPDYSADTTDSGETYGPNWYDPAGDTLTFMYEAKDNDSSDGVTYSPTATATITVDDTPYATDSAAVNVVENMDSATAVSVSGNVLTDGANFLAGVDYQSTHGDSASVVHQVQFTNAAGTYNSTALITSGSSGSGGYTFTADFGTLFIKADGSYTFTPNGSLDHGAAGNDLSFKFKYTIIDQDGDISNLSEQIVNIQDGAAPTIGATVDTSVVEAYLDNGTDPAGGSLTQSATLNVTTGTDAVDTTFDATQTNLDTLIGNALSSGGETISYTITNSGHTLTGVADGENVFIVDITDPTNTGAGTGYTFQLLKAIDHKPALGLDGNGDLDFIFNVTANNDDDPTIDKDSDTFTVKVVDDSPSAQSISTNEETAVTMTTNADATQANTSIFAQGTYGTAVVNANGKITYTPTSGEDFSGEDTFTYRTAADDGSTVDTVVTVNVNPISDTPTWNVHAGVSGNEDAATIALNLALPNQSDGTDRNAGTANDAPERFGLIEVDGIPTGVVIKKGGATIFTGDGSTKMKVHISDGNFHPTDLDTTGSVSMTQAEYAALTITPKANDGTDMTLTLSVTSHEVTDAGADKGVAVSSAATTTVAIEVEAVTDDVTASFVTANGGSVTGDEDGWIRVDNLFTFTPNDTDGSETYTLKFDAADLPAGTTYRVNGGSSIDASSGFDVIATNGTIPTIELMTGAHDSNDINGLSVTLELKDTDGDSSHTPATITKTIDIDVLVNPVANDSTINGGGTSGNEDTKISMGLNFTSTDSETMDSLTISGIPNGAIIYKADGTTLVWTSDGTDLVIDVAGVDPAGEDVTLTEAEIEGLLILPPKDSNTDITIGLSSVIRNVDDNGVQSAVTSTITASNKKITVIGVVDTSAGDLDTADAGRLYTEIDNTLTSGTEISFAGVEDVVTNLNAIVNSYENQTNSTTDNSEVATIVIRNQSGDTNDFYITNSSGVNIGTKSSAGWTLTQAELAIAHVKAVENFAGTINLEMETTIVESGDDSAFDTNVQVDTFEIVISPTVDEPTIQVRDLIVQEDSTVKLDIRAVSSDIDGSESTVSVLIDDIPSGTALKLGDGTTVFVNNTAGVASYLLTVDGALTDTLKSASGSDTGGKITAANLDNLYISIPPHLDGKITLNVTPTIGEGGSTNTADAPIPVNIHIEGVADTPTINLTDVASGDVNAGIKVNGSDIGDGATQAFNDGETIVVFGQERTNAGSNRIPLAMKGITGEASSLTVSTDPAYNTAKEAGDTSETLTYVLDGVPTAIGITNSAGVKVGTLLSVTGGLGKWALTDTEITTGVYFDPPEDYSGIVTGLSLDIVVTEDGGDATSKNVPFSLHVNSVIETTDPIKNISGIEDATVGGAGAKGDLIDLNFEVSDSSGSETITRVEILTSTFKAAGSAEHLELYVKNGGSWVLATNGNVPGIIKGTGASEYYDLTSFKDDVAVGVKVGGGLEHTHKTDNSLQISGVTIDVVDSDSMTPDVSQTFTDSIIVSLHGRADAAVFGVITPTAVAASGDLMNFNMTEGVNVTWPDDDASQFHFYILEVPNSSWAFNKGSNNGDNTWYLTPADLVGLKIQGPNGFVNAEIKVAAYSDENTRAITNTTVTISDVDTGVGATHDGTGSLYNSATDKDADAPTLALNSASTTEDVSIALNSIVNVGASGLNDLDGGTESLAFILKDVPAGVEVTGTFVSYTDPSGFTSYRIPVTGTINDALAAVSLTPKDDFSGDFNVSIYAISTEGANGGQASSIVGSSGNATIRVTPIADQSVLDSSAMTKSVIEDTKTQIKFNLTVGDSSTDANDSTEVLTNISIKISEGSFVDVSDNVLSTTELAVTIVGGIVKFGGNDVYYLPPEHKHGNFNIVVEYDVEDQTTYADPLTLTDTKLNQTANITVTAAADPDTHTDFVTVQNETTNEDTPVKLNLVANFTDNDGSENQHLTISGMPHGSLLQNAAGEIVGKNNGDGSWLIESADLADLYFSPSPNQSGEVTLNFNQHALEGSDSTFTIGAGSKSFTVTVNPIADGVIITPTNVTGSEDEFIKTFLEGTLYEQGYFNVSPIKDPGNGGANYVSDELYKVQFSGVKSTMDFFYKSGSDYIEIADEDAAADSYLMSQLTQTQFDNLYIRDTAHETGTFDLAVNVYSQEVNGTTVLNTSGATTDSIRVGISAVSGNDTVNGDGSDNYLYGHSGDDTVNGSGGNDHLFGGSGVDILNGGAGNDKLDGGDGADTINGDAGTDQIVFDIEDTVDGGADFDTFVLQDGASIDFDAITTTNISNMESFDLKQGGNHTIDNLGIADILQITDGNNELKIFGDAGDTVNLKNGDSADWTQNGTVTEDSVTFNVFDQVADSNVLTLKVEDTINFTIA
ncbi:MAG: hypothetical protein KC646_17170 [Candidatus Cloacimonetes bacterium]|nr:hypothetical protein [Candidatus Cloacimonadota bacterium]